MKQIRNEPYGMFSVVWTTVYDGCYRNLSEKVWVVSETLVWDEVAIMIVHWRSIAAVLIEEV